MMLNIAKTSTFVMKYHQVLEVPIKTPKDIANSDRALLQDNYENIERMVNLASRGIVGSKLNIAG